MTLVELLGCVLVTFGPPAAMFVVTVAKKPIHVILLMASAFFWQVALMFSSLLWFIPGPKKTMLLVGLIFSVAFQELFRYLFYFVLSKARAGLELVHNQGKPQRKPLNMLAVYYSAGLGYGLVSGAFATVNIFRDLSGPGTVGISGDSQYYFLISSFTALAFVLLHVAWGVVYMGSLDSDVPWRKASGVIGVFMSHMLVSGLTMLNYRDAGDSPVYGATITVAYIQLILMSLWAYNIAGGSGRSIKHFVHPPALTAQG